MKTIASLIGIGLLAVCAHAVDFVNGSFETGDFTGWNVSNAQDGSFLFVYPDSSTPVANYVAAFGDVANEFDTVSQTLATTAGQKYELSFWLGTTGDDVIANIHPQEFQVTWDNTTLFSGPAPTPDQGGIQMFTYTVWGTGSDIASFAGDNFWSNTHLTGVHLEAVPEPKSFLALGAGVLLLARRRRK